MKNILISHLGKTTIYSGTGSRRYIQEILDELKVKKPLIVTDRDLAELPAVKEMIKSIDNAIIFNGVHPNPKDVEVMNAAETYKLGKCDGIIGLGGGSSMDAAKATSAIVRHDGFIMDYGRSTPNRKFFANGREKLILIPTTCGTGSEISPHAVITNTSKNRKSDIQDKLFYPDFIVLDPDFISTLPSKVIKDTAIDALCHAVEVYTSKNSIEKMAPLHTEAALKAIELIAQNLRSVLKEPRDMKAASAMQWAASLAGFALDLDATIGHGLAGQLQKYHHDMSHGESVGVLLPSILKYDMEYCLGRMKKIAVAFGEDVTGLTKQEAAEKAISAIRRLLKDIQFATLSDFMKDPAEIDEFYVEGALNSCNKNNIRPVQAEEIKQVYLNAYHDTYE